MGLPTWTGVASITGRTISRISGDNFAPGWPALGIFLDFAAPYTQVGGFRTWYVDPDTLATDIDATYELLIPAGTTAAFSVDQAVQSLYFQSVCYTAGGSNSVFDADPDQTIRDKYPSFPSDPTLGDLPFGGDSFKTGVSAIQVGQTVFIEGQTATASLIGSDTQLTTNLSGPAGRYAVLWHSDNPPPIGAAVVKAIDVLAFPVGSSTPLYPRTGQSFDGSQLQFQATVRANTTINTSVTWSLSGNGSITSGGLWTRSGSGRQGIITVTAVSNQDGTTSASYALGLL
jgi:hypothetical protein